MHVQALAASPDITGLTVLDLSHNAIGGGGIHALATSTRLNRLTKLDLSYNEIDIVFPEDVADLLASPNLQRLALLKMSGAVYSEKERVTLQARFGNRVHF